MPRPNAGAGQPLEGSDRPAPDGKPDDTRVQREAAALRENLRRRKQQLRARQAREQDGAKR